MLPIYQAKPTFFFLRSKSKRLLYVSHVPDRIKYSSAFRQTSKTPFKAISQPVHSSSEVNAHLLAKQTIFSSIKQLSDRQSRQSKTFIWRNLLKWLSQTIFEIAKTIDSGGEAVLVPGVFNISGRPFQMSDSQRHRVE